MRNLRKLVAVACLAVVAVPVGAATGSVLGVGNDPPGSPGNPLVAPPLDQHAAAAAAQRGHLNEAEAPNQPLDEPAEVAASQRPCTLVTGDQASEILDAAVHEPTQAPQGPTCVYRATSGSGFATVAIQTLDIAHLKPLIDGAETLPVGGKTAYCGPSALYVPLSGQRVLTVGAECAVAVKFAAKALTRTSR